MSAPWRTALVTGASAGIGASLVRLLAERGVARVVVVARRAAALETLASEVHAAHPGTSVEVLVADLADPDGCVAVEARLASADEPIDLLVNNAGFGTAGAFWELPLDGEAREVALNAVAVLRLSHAALGPMVARGRGAVVNVSSLASNQPTPGMATYGATKAFVTMFTEGLAQDLRGTGVTATAVLPGYTRTEFAAAMGGNGPNPEAASSIEAMAPAFAWLTADAVAAETLDAAAAGKVLCIPGAGYKVVNALEAPLPRTARRWLIGRLVGAPARLARRDD